MINPVGSTWVPGRRSSDARDYFGEEKSLNPRKKKKKKYHGTLINHNLHYNTNINNTQSSPPVPRPCSFQVPLLIQTTLMAFFCSNQIPTVLIIPELWKNNRHSLVTSFLLAPSNPNAPNLLPSTSLQNKSKLWQYNVCVHILSLSLQNKSMYKQWRMMQPSFNPQVTD